MNKALKIYSGEKEWSIVASSDDGTSKDWKREGAFAFLVDGGRTAHVADLPINSLVITTDDFNAEVERQNSQSSPPSP